ncbi:MAG TPA: glycosyltransferase family 4 protein [Bacteroidia bacterium]|nr:glycosyltransferase family 4 protein [Bacteroidia bacterium]
MKILHVVESYWPSVGGMQEVVRQLSERLAAKGHAVTVACRKIPERNESIHKGVQIVDFAVEGLSIRELSGETKKYEDWLRASGFDIVTFFAAQHWATDLALPLLDQIHAKKVFVPTGFSMLYNPAYKTYYEKMPAWLKKFDCLVFLSDDYRDINFARKHGLSKLELIPNGAAADEFGRTDLPEIRKKFKIPGDQKLILHVGSFTGMKGQKEAIEIFDRAAVENVTLLFIGNDPEKFQKQFNGITNIFQRLRLAKKSKRVIIRSADRDEAVAAYKTADLFLFPSNIECSPIVLFEAMAGKTAFLVTDVGNSNEIIRWSGGGALLPTSIDQHGYSHAEKEGSAKLLEELIKNDSKREQLAESGHKAWREKFTWELIADRYEIMYKSLLTEK